MTTICKLRGADGEAQEGATGPDNLMRAEGAALVPRRLHTSIAGIEIAARAQPAMLAMVV